MTARCTRCGESFPVEPSDEAAQLGGEVYARPRDGRARRGRGADLFAGAATAGADSSHPARATREERASPAISNAAPLTGERNESSVLFSLAALGTRPLAPPARDVTESSALIDIRALLSATSKADAATQRADDIASLSGGGAFAPLFAPPVTFVPPSEESMPRSRVRVMLGAVALVVAAMVGAAGLAVVRPASRAPSFTTAAATATTTATTTTATAQPASETQLAAVTPPRTGTPSDDTTPARSSARSKDARPVAVPARTASANAASTASANASNASNASSSRTNATSTTSAAAMCCPGESVIACHMRVAAGAACSAEPPRSTVTSTAPFDRPAAARALGIDVRSCKRGDGPTGPGHVKVTFQPSGSVSAVGVDAPYVGTPTGACIAQRFRDATVPAFAGGPLTVGKGFAIEP